MSISAEDVSSETLRRWDLSAIREYIKRILAVMHGDDRGPEDYDIRRDERRALVSVLRDLLKEIRSRPPPSMHNGDSNEIKKWIVGLGIVISGAFIIGGWTLSNKVAGQTVQIDNLTTQVRELNARVTRIEQQANERR